MAISGSQKAYLYALSGIARSGATRSGYTSGYLFLSLGGNHLGYGNVVGGGIGVLIDGLTITDTLDEVPNRCAFRIKGSPYVQTGTEVIITLGSKNNGERLFAGYTLDVRQVYVGDKPANVQAEVSAVDYTWLLGFVKVTGRYTNQSASTIATDLVARYAAVNGFTAANVQADLPTVSEITFTNDDLTDCLTRLARRIGAYWYVDYRKDVHFFFTEVGNGAPENLTPTHRSLADFVINRDRSQVLTRVYVEGRGTTVIAAVPIGETRIPVEAVDMFVADTDVFAKVSFQGSDGAAQHLDFTGVVPGGAGSIVGPGIGPSAAPTLTAQLGAGVTSGAHGYAVTFVTASGESLPSPTASVSTGSVPNPTVAPTATQGAQHAWQGSQIPIGRTVQFTYSYALDGYSVAGSTGLTLISPISTALVTISNLDSLNPTQSAPINISIPYSADPRVKWIIVWATEPVATAGKWVLFRSQIPNYPQYAGVYTVFTDTVGAGISDVGYYAPVANTTATNQIALSNIALGGAAVTQRKVYRTAADLAQLKLLTTIANNTATTYLDTLADASLGANVPTSDTSGLTQPAGQVLPGATTLPVAGTGPFQAGGGWAVIGNGEQVVRYTGLTGSTLTGIPASGTGSVTAAISYNSTVTAAPMLTGIPATGARSLSTRGLTPGDELYVVVQRDNLAAQPQLATTLGVGNGIREEWLQDRRLSIPEARARGDATLSLHQLEARGVSYTCRDTRTAAGKMIYVNLPLPTNVTGEEYRIQQVTISNFRPHANQYPTYTVEASLTKFSFEDWLRRLQPVAQE